MSNLLARNALANVLQMLVGAVLLFILYRFINDRLGTAALGVWSVVMATVSASRVANFGIGEAATRFVARYLARGERTGAAQVIETATITLMVILVVVLPLLYWPLNQLLGYLFDGAHLEQARALLPYALVSLGFMVLGAVFQSGFDGCQRMALRAGLVVTGQLLWVGLSFWLIPEYGLIGLALAQIAQGVFFVIVGWWRLRRLLSNLPFIPHRCSFSIFREMLGYGANIQVATIFQMFFDPTAKAFMAHFGGAVAVGYFAMASQVVLKVGALIVAANRAIVPHAAHIMETEPAHLSTMYREHLRVLVFVTLPTFALLFAWAGLFSHLLTGRFEAQFIFLLHLSAVAWCLNIFAGPAYFINMGTGRVGWNTLAQVTMGVINAMLGWILGSLYGVEGVAWAYAVALVAGGGLLMIVYQRRSIIKWRDLILKEHLWVVTASLAVLTVGYYEPVLMSWNKHAQWVITFVLVPMTLATAVWYHPLRKRLWARFFGTQVSEAIR